MRLQSARLGERSRTLCASVWTEPRVPASVNLQRRGRCESRIATILAAKVGFFLCVDADVDIEVVGGIEGQAAFLTDNRPFPGVPPHVAFECDALREACMADFTLEGPVPSMASHMHRQRPGVLEHRTTYITLVISLIRMCPHVCLEVRNHNKLGVAVWAMVFSLVGMLERVNFEVAGIFKSLATDTAIQGFFIRVFAHMLFKVADAVKGRLANLAIDYRPPRFTLFVLFLLFLWLHRWL